MPEWWVSVTDANLNQQEQSSERMNRTRVAVEPSVLDEDSSLYSSRYKPAFVNAQWVVPACAANYSEEDFSAACPSLPQTRVGSFSAILVASPWHGLRNDDRRIEHHQSCRSVNLQQNHNELPRVFHCLSFQKREKRGKLRTEHAMNIYESTKDWKRLQKKLNMEYMKQSQTLWWNPTLAPRGSVFPEAIAKSKLRQKRDIAIIITTPLRGGVQECKLHFSESKTRVWRKQQKHTKTTNVQTPPHPIIYDFFSG